MIIVKLQIKYQQQDNHLVELVDKAKRIAFELNQSKYSVEDEVQLKTLICNKLSSHQVTPDYFNVIISRFQTHIEESTIDKVTSRLDKAHNAYQIVGELDTTSPASGGPIYTEADIEYYDLAKQSKEVLLYSGLLSSYLES